MKLLTFFDNGNNSGAKAHVIQPFMGTDEALSAMKTWIKADDR